MTTPSTTNVLFVSRENACRSLLAEACLRRVAVGGLVAYSCGVPDMLAERPHRWTLLALQTAAISARGLHCKDWTAFTGAEAPRMDFVIALDAATVAQQPVWPGQPDTTVWDYPDIAEQHKIVTNPGDVTMHTLHSLRRRIELFAILCAKGKSRADLSHDLHDLAFV